MKKSDFRPQILHQLRRSAKPLSADMLASLLRIKKGERARFLLSLKALEDAGELTRNKKGKYVRDETADCLRARVISLSEGFGFVHLEKEDTDCFIPGRYLQDALPGDIVLVRVERTDARGPQGEIVRIEEAGQRLYSGRLRPAEYGHFEVVPDSMIRFPLPVRRSGIGNARENDKVRFSVERNRHGEWMASVVTSYGSTDSARVCADAIVDTMGIPTEFPAEVLEQAERLASDGVTDKDLRGREDFRERCIFTIDGQDAKDLDDAVSLEPAGDGWLLGVHIADVSRYVRYNSPLDVQARERGTSVYFADRVIPMLPEALSNGICSLNAGTDKLTLSALLTLDKKGECRNVKVVKSVIRSRVRGVYSEINDLFQNTASAEVREKYVPVADTLHAMRELAAQLREIGNRRGTLDLISHEAQFVLDEAGAPAAIFPRVTGEAEGMIEQFMIAANVAVAKLARERKLPFIYRIHEQPNAEKLSLLIETARQLGLEVPPQAESLDPLALRELMENARDTKYARLVSERLLRGMAKARYSRDPLGHYGLAQADYCHFTSPIRRYPDLVIHRILSDYLAHTSKAHLYERYGDFVASAADTSSACEVRAMTAERDCEACYKAEYMAGYLGRTFTGVVSSVTDFGVYVELPNTVEGLIRLEDLSEEPLRYDGVAALVNELGKKVVTIGDAFAIQVAACDISTGRIRFLPAAQ